MSESIDLRANVMAFHAEVIGGEMPGYPSVPEETVARRRLRLIKEEFFEVLRASFDTSDENAALAMGEAEHLVGLIVSHTPLGVDLIQLAHELADLAYVTEGALIGFGIDSRPVHAAVHAANMAKKGGEVRPDGKRLRPSGWTPPDIGRIIREQMTGKS